jgi:hypothetical protein
MRVSAKERKNSVCAKTAVIAARSVAFAVSVNSVGVHLMPSSTPTNIFQTLPICTATYTIRHLVKLVAWLIVGRLHEMAAA